MSLELYRYGNPLGVSEEHIASIFRIKVEKLGNGADLLKARIA
jgi:hypothetical protein